MKYVFGFVLAFVLAGVVFVGKAAYDDHKVVSTLSVLATEIGKQDGKPVTATDVVAALVQERLEQIKGAQAIAKAQAEEAAKQKK
jgi:hypothetical protein